jgi:general stress protein YciG
MEGEKVMAGTIFGGWKASETNKRKYGEDFYVRIGKLGGGAPYSGLKGFAANPKLASKAGKRGGHKSSRLGIKNGQGKKYRPVAWWKRLLSKETI